MYINYNTVNGIEYGTLTTSIRKGRKVGKSDRVYLGRVIDKERGVFKSRDRGLFIYDLQTNTFCSVPAEYETPSQQRKTKTPRRATLVVSFGDIFLLDEYLRKSGLQKAVDAIGYRNPDTLKALLAFYILTRSAMRRSSGMCGRKTSTPPWRQRYIV